MMDSMKQIILQYNGTNTQHRLLEVLTLSYFEHIKFSIRKAKHTVNTGRWLVKEKVSRNKEIHKRNGWQNKAMYFGDWHEK